jgi:hypothetical protein
VTSHGCRNEIILKDSIVVGNGNGVVSDWILKLINCTVASNVGYGLRIQYNRIDVLNSIIYGNGRAFDPFSDNHFILVRNSLVQGGQSSLGSVFARQYEWQDNLVADPRFVSIAAGDYRLRDDSPAIGAGGKGVQISTAEGGIFKPSPNDQIAVAPNAVDGLKNLNVASQLGKMSVMPITGGIGTAAAIDILVNEMKALRQDMNAGKIGVYMDGMRVTSGIAVASEKSTRNNFNYGQRT